MDHVLAVVPSIRVLRGAYGMTETTSPPHLGPPDLDAPVDPDSGALAVGVPVPDAGCASSTPRTGAISDPAEQERSEQADHRLRSDGGARLLAAARGIRHAIRRGWLHTGDIGKKTEDGWLFVVDRLKDMINAGGYKIFPRDVEDVFYQHPAAREACVVGVPDEYRGRRSRRSCRWSPTPRPRRRS